jgi:hypothetical protein
MASKMISMASSIRSSSMSAWIMSSLELPTAVMPVNLVDLGERSMPTHEIVSAAERGHILVVVQVQGEFVIVEVGFQIEADRVAGGADAHESAGLETGRGPGGQEAEAVIDQVEVLLITQRQADANGGERWKKRQPVADAGGSEVAKWSWLYS